MSANVFPTLALQRVEVSLVPSYSTRILESVSGKELRVSWRSASRTMYAIRYDALRTDASGRGNFTSGGGSSGAAAFTSWAYNSGGSYTEQSIVQAFIDTHRGSWDSFFFNDPISNTQVRVRFVEDSITYRKFASGMWAVDSLKLIQVL